MARHADADAVRLKIIVTLVVCRLIIRCNIVLNIETRQFELPVNDLVSDQNYDMELRIGLGRGRSTSSMNLSTSCVFSLATNGDAGSVVGALIGD